MRSGIEYCRDFSFVLQFIAMMEFVFFLRSFQFISFCFRVHTLLLHLLVVLVCTYTSMYIYSEVGRLHRRRKRRNYSHPPTHPSLTPPHPRNLH